MNPFLEHHRWITRRHFLGQCRIGIGAIALASLIGEAGGSHVSLRAMDTAAEFVGSRRVGYAGPGDYVAALETFMQAVRDA